MITTPALTIVSKKPVFRSMVLATGRFTTRTRLFSGWKPGCQDRGVLKSPKSVGKGRDSLHHLRPHGERDLEYGSGAYSGRRVGAGIDLAKAEAGHWGRDSCTILPLSHGRAYSQDEIWENFRYFVAQAAPVAEEAGVRMVSTLTTRRSPNLEAFRGAYSVASTATTAP